MTDDLTLVPKKEVINNLTSTATDVPLSAAQGKVLNDTKVNNGYCTNTYIVDGVECVFKKTGRICVVTVFGAAATGLEVKGVPIADKYRTVADTSVTIFDDWGRGENKRMMWIYDVSLNMSDVKPGTSVGDYRGSLTYVCANEDM